VRIVLTMGHFFGGGFGGSEEDLDGEASSCLMSFYSDVCLSYGV
jgi:hypothetical protein